jgi:SET domain-containing protein
MLTVKTKIGPSFLHGIGLFAGEFISRGSVTWRYNAEFDTAFSREQINRLPTTTQDYLFKYAYFDKILNKYVLCFDDQRFINHSSHEPNILSTPREDRAARDIQPGEELTCDYNQYDDTYFSRLGIDQSMLAAPTFPR